ncbi:hypothetical protein SDC9_205080 [bioreactor metagenome]|uniref:Uncharacterized protein n=1 Tax=bioreactor metagenome TaxID=1076179 RepID=A0A645J1Q4_9ZZZZ
MFHPLFDLFHLLDLELEYKIRFLRLFQKPREEAGQRFDDIGGVHNPGQDCVFNVPAPDRSHERAFGGLLGDFEHIELGA